MSGLPTSHNPGLSRSASLGPSIRTGPGQSHTHAQSNQPRPTALERRDSGPVDHFPEGLPRILAERSGLHNGIFFRAFRRLTPRCLLYIQGRLGFLEDKLMSLERETQEHLKSLTPYQCRMPGEECVIEKYDAIMEAMIKEACQYNSLLLPFSQIRSLPKTSKEDVDLMLKELSGHDGSGQSGRSTVIDDETRRLLNVPDDYVHARKDLVDAFMMKILRWSYVRRFFKLFIKPHPDGHLDISITPVRIFMVVGVSLAGQVLLAWPVVVLYLLTLTRPVSIAVVLVAVLLFHTVLCIAPEITLQQACIGSATYLVVLCTFLGRS